MSRRGWRGFNWEKAQQMPKVNVWGKSKKEENIESWTCLLVYVIKPSVSSNDYIGYPSKKKLELFHGLC
jgi:hypothetical protein